MSDSVPLQEFKCIDCGIAVVLYGGQPGANLCSDCIYLPGWQRDAYLRRILRPEHPAESEEK